MRDRAAPGGRPQQSHVGGSPGESQRRSNNAGIPGFWGKFDSTTGEWLPLSAHCLDVAVCFRGLSDLPGLKRSLRESAGRDLDTCDLDRLAVLAMLHDIGKANLGFQTKVFDLAAPKAGHVRELEPLFDDQELFRRLADAIALAEIGEWFEGEHPLESFLMASWSHHGRPLIFKDKKAGFYWKARREWWRPSALQDPMAAVAEIILLAREAFPVAFNSAGHLLPSSPQFHHRFAGLVMLADWLGSHSHWFPIRVEDPSKRLQYDRVIVPKELSAVGLDVARLRDFLLEQPGDFAKRFGFAPRPLQSTVDGLDPDDELTRLVIAESETGSGKTEAALDWFFKLFLNGTVDALYFALPTRVAARELYGRIVLTLRRWFPEEQLRPVAVLAVPGYAQVDGLALEEALPEGETGTRWQDDEDLRRRERRWAAEHPKRFLGATVAVGTIDQALLSAVQTAHAHLRSVCLDRSLLVVDEVHASDNYMSLLLEGLLRHHLSVGGRAMLLSATLGASARQRFANVCHEVGASLPGIEEAQSAPYPAITLANGRPRATAATPETGRRVCFEQLAAAFQPEQLAARLVAALEAGARVLVVLNTVARANYLVRALEAYSALDPCWLFNCASIACPHHGRFAPRDRLLLDAEVSRRLGPHSAPGPVVLVGTQTLEQSLDIDADLLISDLAPADVLLQRVGRLHRHDRPRSSGFEEARCLLLVPDGPLGNALDERGYVAGPYKRIGYGSVYKDLRTLELTRRALVASPEVAIPRDSRRLVEAVTHPDSLASLPDLPGLRFRLRPPVPGVKPGQGEDVRFRDSTRQYQLTSSHPPSPGFAWRTGGTDEQRDLTTARTTAPSFSTTGGTSPAVGHRPLGTVELPR